MNLPELPSPHNIINGVWYYTAEQVREAVRMEREACAKLCESYEGTIQECMGDIEGILAAKIRSRTAVPAKE